MGIDLVTHYAADNYVHKHNGNENPTNQYIAKLKPLESRKYYYTLEYSP